MLALVAVIYCFTSMGRTGPIGHLHVTGQSGFAMLVAILSCKIRHVVNDDMQANTKAIQAKTSDQLLNLTWPGDNADICVYMLCLFTVDSLSAATTECSIVNTLP